MASKTLENKLFTFSYNKSDTIKGHRLYPLGAGPGTPYPRKYHRIRGVGIRWPGHRAEIYLTSWYK